MSLKTLQAKAGTTPDGVFGPNTFKVCGFFLGIENKDRAVHFFAQCGHETGGFKRFDENLNYSWEGLRNTFSKYFKTDEEAKLYHRQPEKIANRVYGNRMGNGDELSGDGWKYRGRGALQLTGRFNYQQFSAFQNDHDIITNPNVVANDYSFHSAMHFFTKNNLWKICDEGISEDVVKKLTQRINGGQNGYAHRLELTLKYDKYAW